MARNNPDYLCRIYVWSLILEPLLYFVLADRDFTGVGGNVSRIFQLVVIIILIWRGSKSYFNLKIPNPLSPLYRNYTIYFILLVISGLIGILRGVYSYENNYGDAGQSQISHLLNSPFARPIFEYFITIYYFVYFGILPKYLIKSEIGINYFFRTFKRIFILCLLLGYIDFILGCFGYEWIPRHMLEGRYVGVRWHGIAGEPRDAFIYLLFGLAILNLQQYWNNKGAISKKWIGFIFLTLLLTQSASGLIGLVFTGILIIAFEINFFSLKRMAQSFLIIIALLFLIYIGVSQSPRLVLYAKSFTDTWNAIGEGHPITNVFVGQMPDIYPLWDIIKSARNFNIFPVLFGNGLGSASVLNNQFGGYNDLANPNSQIIRIIYEAGVIGLIFFTYAFVTPIRKLTKNLSKKTQRIFLLLLLIIIGCFFGHRSSVLFIYFGIFTLVFQAIPMLNEKQTNEEFPVQK